MGRRSSKQLIPGGTLSPIATAGYLGGSSLVVGSGSFSGVGIGGAASFTVLRNDDTRLEAVAPMVVRGVSNVSSNNIMGTQNANDLPGFQKRPSVSSASQRRLSTLGGRNRRVFPAGKDGSILAGAGGDNSFNGDSFDFIGVGDSTRPDVDGFILEGDMLENQAIEAPAFKALPAWITRRVSSKTVAIVCFVLTLLLTIAVVVYDFVLIGLGQYSIDG
ncbi:hypothetical protein HK405_004262 [Cladochytrium tenue]|nr:hypothetical protein HK405_004262 [Cladochytrium tenue]